MAQAKTDVNSGKVYRLKDTDTTDDDLNFFAEVSEDGDVREAGVIIRRLYETVRQQKGL